MKRGMNTEIYPAGTVVHKKSNKPFLSGLLNNTVKGVVDHPYKKGVKGYTFLEDESIVECQICYKV